MRYKSKRAKATDIPKAVKEKVFERDNGCCVFCGRPGLPNAHYISRAHGGLGIEENILTACPECHRRMDNSTDRKTYLEAAEAYLRRVYQGSWDATRLIYKKGES